MAVARRTLWALVGLGLLFIAVQGFSWHAMSRGVLAFGGDMEALGRLAGTAASNLAIFSHMILGGFATLLAVLQWAGPVRRRWPRVHRASGRVLAVLALLTGIGGLVYILMRGTIGGWPMSLGFGLYGVLTIVAAIQTPRFAMARDYARHRRWGLRLIVLVLGSWIYRVHYGLLYGITCSVGEPYCGMGSTSDFSGPFDLVMNVGFYLPYLVLLEVILRTERTPDVNPS